MPRAGHNRERAYFHLDHEENGFCRSFLLLAELRRLTTQLRRLEPFNVYVVYALFSVPNRDESYTLGLGSEKAPTV